MHYGHPHYGHPWPYGYPPPAPYYEPPPPVASAGAVGFGAAHFGAAHFGAYDPYTAHMLAMAGALPAAPAPAPAPAPPHPAHMVHAPHMAMHHAPHYAYAGPPAQIVQGAQPFPYGPDQYIPPQHAHEGPDRFEHTPLGIPETDIPKNATATIVVRPQVRAYRPRGLVIPSSIGANFTVQSITVGTDLVFAGQEGGVPALVFSELAAQKVGFVTRSAPTALDITIIVRNKDPLNTQTFSGTYFGDAYR